MCGITASITLAGRPGNQASGHHHVRSSAEEAAKVKSARDKLDLQLIQSLGSIHHRGPDSSGRWISANGLVGLGNTRLQINDLTPTGDQPFQNSTKTITVVVNGEIYNHEELRADILQKTNYKFRGTSDCECVLALYEHYGLAFLPRLNGEYAFCIYDSDRQVVIAARDRTGVKPLFWTIVDQRLLIASEVKALLPFGWKPAWDVRSLRDAGWNTDERTIFQDVNKIPPGSYLKCIGLDHIEVRRYWDLDFPDRENIETRSKDELIEGVRERLLDAVRIRLQADVPVGIYLSGGIDSSVILGMAKYLLDKGHVKLGSGGQDHKLICLGVAFAEGSGYDESEIAARSAERLGVSFQKVVMNEADLAADFEEAAFSSEQHYFDLGFVAKHTLSRLTRSAGLKVVLNGQGSDEFLAGYDTYRSDFLSLPDKSWPQTELSEQRRKDMLNILEAAERKPRMNFTPTPAYLEVHDQIPFSDWTNIHGQSDALLTLAENVDERVRELMRTKWHPLNSALYTWYKCHLPNLLLTCIGDRTEMSNSVEGRTPFLDYLLVEYVNGIPPSLKLRYNRHKDQLVEKYILREASKPFISDEIYQRRKHAYASPVIHPINGPLHQLMSRLITHDTIEALGFLDWTKVESMVATAFETQDKRLMGVIFVIAQWVVLSQRFGVPKATKPYFNI